jgi:hypothetical protein
MRSAIGGTPDANARGVNFWPEGDPGDGVAIVLVLFGWKNLSARLSFRGSLVAIIKDQGDEARGNKSFSEHVQVHFFHWS